MTKPVCRHCHNPKRKVNRPLGLCWTCYYTPGIRSLYPSTSKYRPGQASEGDVCRNVLPTRATKALPMTRRKLRILEKRCARREALHHPGDAQRSLA